MVMFFNVRKYFTANLKRKYALCLSSLCHHLPILGGYSISFPATVMFTVVYGSLYIAALLSETKVFVILSLNWIALSYGFTHGQIAGMIGALQKKEEGIELGDGQISLIAAFVNLCLIIGILQVAVLGQKIGRRWLYILCSVPAVVNWIVLYYARTFTHFMISRLLAGISIGPLSALNTLITAEYTDPNSRGIHLSVITVLVPTFGIALGHILGVLFHWRSLALIGLFLSTIHVFLPYFWVESPHWLAMKGRFEECKTAFRRLHGVSDTTEHELDLLIKIETNKRKVAVELKSEHILGKLLIAFRKRYFWDLLLMASIVYIYYAAAGKVIFSNLATVILTDITGSSDVLLYTCIVDAFILLGTLLSCFFIKKTSVRILLFSSGIISIVILLIFSCCLYFKNSEVYFQWLNVTLLALYFVIIHSGPYPVMEIMLGEMFPLELKLYCVLVTSPMILATLFLSVMMLPYLVSVMGYHGLFLTNSIIMSVCLLFFYVRLPETKGKTLQEIEVYFKTKNFDVDKVLSSNEQIKALV